MNRTFHARIAGYHYLALVLLALSALSAIWNREGVLMLIWMFLLVVVIERIIHTRYTITPENQLLLFFGRFARKRSVPLAAITAVSIRHSARLGRYSLRRYLFIEYGNGAYVALLPRQEQAFMELLAERMAGIEKLT